MQGTRLVRLLISSDDARIVQMLKRHLPMSRFTIVEVGPDDVLSATDDSALFHIAVIDHVSSRPDTTRRQIAALKRINPLVRIIAITEQSTPADAWVIEQGLFFYLTSPVNNQLVRVVEAAALSTVSS